MGRSMPQLKAAGLFGERLILTQDLDPIYTMLWASKQAGEIKDSQLKRWLLSYWCFYNAGLASIHSKWSGGSFYAAMSASLEKGRRGAERRHFRGAAAKTSIAGMRSRFPIPEDLPSWIYGTGPTTMKDVQTRAGQIHLFGPWISWKLADMGERILGLSISFAASDLCMYKDPLQGAALVATGDWQAEIPNQTVTDVCRALEKELGHLKAPPRMDRTPNVQEVETILCKFKACSKGHYYIGKDTKDIEEALEQSGGTLNHQLLGHLKRLCRS